MIAFLLAGSLCGSALGKRAITVIVDGNRLSSDTAPILVDGSVFVSARSLAEALGATVSWDNDDRTIYITSNTGRQKSSSIGLSAIDYADTNQRKYLCLNHWEDEAFAIGGVKYKLGVGFNMHRHGNMAYITYRLGCVYDRLTGDFGTDDRDWGIYSGSILKAGKNALTIYGDGEILYQSPLVAAGNKDHFDIDISAVNTLKLVFDTSAGSYPVVVDPRLYKY